MKWFDTHAHLQAEEFKDDYDLVIRKAKNLGVEKILLPGSNFADSKAGIELALEFQDVYCAVGIHPEESLAVEVSALDSLFEMVSAANHKAKINGRDPVVRAIGEIGIDYHYPGYDQEKQAKLFWRQIEIAYELELPLIIHIRDAMQDCYDLIKKAHQKGILRALPGVCHCYSGSKEMALEFLKLGFYFGFDGPITFKNNKKAPEIIRAIPQDRIVLETDSPYLTPHPYRGKRNESSYIPLIGQKLAEILELSVEAVAELTWANSLRLYQL